MTYACSENGDCYRYLGAPKNDKTQRCAGQQGN